MRKYVYLLGNPLTHTVGPVIMQAAFNHWGLDIRCEEWELAPDQLEQAAMRIRQEDVLGASLTIPYKESIIPYLDGLDEQAQLMGAIAAIAKREGKLIGYNTDSVGFLQGLIAEGDFQPKDKRVVILGAGGAARGCSFILASSGVASITIVNRTLSRAQGLASELKQVCPDVQVMDYEDSRLREAIQNSELLVNCTSFGMKWSSLDGKCPIKEGLIPRGQLVYDIVYKPLETPLMRMAREAGARTLSGLVMVTYVCAADVKLWLDREPPIEAMFEGARKAAEQYGY